MSLHFDKEEFAARQQRLQTKMEENKLDAMLLFAQESDYWLTGYDTFGFCFFQCLVFLANGDKVLLTRSADERQARHTSNISDIRTWAERGEASPIKQLKDILFEMDLLGKRIGVEYHTHGMTGAIGIELNSQLSSFANLVDASTLIPNLRAIKSDAEIACIRAAGELTDKAFGAALEVIRPGVNEGMILAAMHNAIFEGGGDYAANEFVIGSGRDALLCRYKSGRRNLEANDQLTLEWAGAYRHYHAAAMKTVLLGKPTPRHLDMYKAVSEALVAVEEAMVPGNTFGDLFDAHAHTVDKHGMTEHRLNACGYSLGARFTPSWMDMPMAYRGNPAPLQENMVVFQHMILADSVTETAMTLGRTYLITNGAPESLSALSLDLPVIAG
ncbi:MAG: aminopeptidase P family protein [Rhodobacteraceae bacterium]|nr:aminopeptidase P family protein [Paracoccaceae bacterium]